MRSPIPSFIVISKKGGRDQYNSYRQSNIYNIPGTSMNTVHMCIFNCIYIYYILYIRIYIYVGIAIWWPFGASYTPTCQVLPEPKSEAFYPQEMHKHFSEGSHVTCNEFKKTSQ